MERTSPAADAPRPMGQLEERAEPPGLQAALARLLTDELLLERLDAEGADEVRRRFQLTAFDHERIIALPVEGLRRYAHSLRIRRLRMMETILPVTTRVVTACRGVERTASEFCAAHPRRVAAEGDDFRERNVEWFTNYVFTLAGDDLPTWLHDIARYEAMRARLACGRDAHEAVNAGIGEISELESGLDDNRLLRASPRVSANVELAEFGHDVLTLLPLAAEAPRRTHGPEHSYVLAQRLRNWRINAYRLGASAYRTLTRCTGAVTVATIAEKVGVPGRDPKHTRQDVLTVVRQAHRQGFVSLGQVSP